MPIVGTDVRWTSAGPYFKYESCRAVGSANARAVRQNRKNLGQNGPKWRFLAPSTLTMTNTPCP